jgi:hypothetical protein
MNETWVTVAVVGVATVLLKGAGPVLLGGRPLPPGVLAVVRLLAPALLAAFVVTSVFASGRALVLDARAVGLAVALLAVLLRAPTLVVIVAAAATTALVRLL